MVVEEAVAEVETVVGGAVVGAVVKAAVVGKVEVRRAGGVVLSYSPSP